ncbi:hypothetical protein CEXT_664101 [Caerostris extrusa]|uniref:Secreted protein n=1 Tax=Caerostris extrusa TaxID=172846 RepID=A0AAV4XX80_CAEEX|nr:hypothetical protein CEXT_664101 [Caerostris extrusa]
MTTIKKPRDKFLVLFNFLETFHAGPLCRPAVCCFAREILSKLSFAPVTPNAAHLCAPCLLQKRPSLSRDRMIRKISANERLRCIYSLGRSSSKKINIKLF